MMPDLLSSGTPASTGSAARHSHTAGGGDRRDVRPESARRPDSDESGGGLQLLTAGRCQEIVGNTGETEPRTTSGTPQLGAERRIVLLGAGSVSSDVVGLVEQLGSGPWEVDLRYRGLIVIRKEAP